MLCHGNDQILQEPTRKKYQVYNQAVGIRAISIDSRAFLGVHFCSRSILASCQTFGPDRSILCTDGNSRNSRRHHWWHIHTKCGLQGPWISSFTLLPFHFPSLVEVDKLRFEYFTSRTPRSFSLDAIATSLFHTLLRKHRHILRQYSVGSGP